ncbi:copper chaperone PCu(A)C [Comamonas sp. J-3]|uniref:copper chaperone PCu(A)C n=1 Tax=Comamonas trifloxystrobinivorans TaxID=3350256 RepID=UPI00372CDF5B
MASLLRPVLASLALLGSASVFAQVTASNAWTRATVPQQQASGVFMDLRSARDNAKLVGVRSEAAASTEIHEMRMEDNVMKMRAVPSIDLPKEQTVSLKPGSYHIMLMGLKKPLNAGDQVELTLDVVHQDGSKESIAVTAPARALGASSAANHNHGKAEAPAAAHDQHKH